MNLHKLVPFLCMRYLEWDGRFLRCTKCGEILGFMYDGGDHLSVAVFEPYVYLVKDLLRQDEPGFIDAGLYAGQSSEAQQAVIESADHPLLVGSLKELAEDISMAVHHGQHRKGIKIRLGKSEDV